MSDICKFSTTQGHPGRSHQNKHKKYTPYPPQKKEEKKYRTPTLKTISLNQKNYILDADKKCWTPQKKLRPRKKKKEKIGLTHPKTNLLNPLPPKKNKTNTNNNFKILPRLEFFCPPPKKICTLQYFFNIIFKP